MPDNTSRFTGRAEDYDRFRQRYPAREVLDRLRIWCSLDASWLIADIGAGTGMLAEVFLENSNRVVAIEPNADMREQMRGAFAPPHPHASQLEIIDASAEATSLPTASVDMVAAGRAFHWFDKDRALAEFRRILKPSGWIVLVSLGRAHSSIDPAHGEQITAFEHLLVERGTDYKYVRSGYRIHDDMVTLFGGGAELHQTQLTGVQHLDWPSFLGNTMSLSVTPQPGDPSYEAFQDELRRYFDHYANHGILTIPTICWITAARFQGP